MEEVSNSTEVNPTTYDILEVDNFTYLTQDVYDVTSFAFSTNGPDDDEYWGPSTLDMILGVAMIFLIIPTVTGNALILIAFWKSRRLRTYFNYFICSMAFADLTVGAVNMPVYSIQFFSGRWPFGPKACLTFSIIDHVFVHVSVLSVVVIAIDRYKSLVNPLVHLRRKSLGRAIVVILPTYLIPIPMWTWFVLYRKQGRNANCYTGKRGEFPFNFVSPFFLYIIPLIILASACVAIYRLIRSRNEKRILDKSKRSLPSESSQSRTVNPRDISSSVVVDDSLRGALNPVFSAEDNDPFQNGCHSDPKLDITDASKAGNTSAALTDKNKDNTYPHACSETVNPDEETINHGESLTPSGVIPEKSSSQTTDNKDDPVVLNDIDTREVPDSVSSNDNGNHESTIKPKMKERRDTRGAIREDSSMSKQSEENMKAVRTLTFIVLALVISWSPWVLFVFIENICGKKCNVESVYHVSFFWVYMNSLLNPFCYAAANRTFRRVIRDFFRR